MSRLQTIATLVRLANTGWHLEANFGCLLKAKCAKALMVNSYVIISHGTRESYFKRLITNLFILTRATFAENKGLLSQAGIG